MTGLLRNWLLALLVGGLFATVAQQPALAAKRKPTKSQAETPLSPNDVVLHKLETMRVHVEFNKTPLREVCAHLAAILEVDILLEPRGLEAIGLTGAEPVTLNIVTNKVSIATVLELVGRQLGTAYCCKDGLLIITNADELMKSEALLTVIYKVGDLIPATKATPRVPIIIQAPAKESKAPPAKDDFDPFAAATPPMVKAGVHCQFCGGGNGGMGGVYTQPERTSMDTLVEMIEQTVDSAGWNTYGGPCSIKNYGELLVVKQTPQAHAELRALLAKLRAAKADFGKFPIVPPDQNSQSPGLQSVVPVVGSNLPANPPSVR